eukprot:scaffold143668_cov75-Phaeocystis_antarctica.AAC.1
MPLPPSPSPSPPLSPPPPSPSPPRTASSLSPAILKSAQRGELVTVVRWLRKGGSVNALCPSITSDSKPATFALLHTAAGSGRLEMVTELLKQGASIDLPTSRGHTALMDAAINGHLST